MERQRKIFWAKMAIAGSAIPLALWAYEFGPNPGYCGVPTEHAGATCTTAGCHTGTTNDPANKGSVVVNFPNGMTYTPGVKQHLSVTISDPAPTQKGWGFQLTARPSNSSTIMAGAFTSTDNRTLLMCSQESAIDFFLDQVNFNSTGSQVCPGADNVQFIEHSQQGWQATLGPGSATYQFDWMPPATNVGNITVYVAGNAGVGVPASQFGDHIYATSYTLTPAAGGGPAPAISAGGVVSASAFGAFTSIAPGSWIEIYGSNLDPNAPASGIQWSGTNFTNGVGPTLLDGVSVSIGGQAAYIAYVSAGQINAQVPSNAGTGSQNVVVTNGNGSSAAYPITVNATEPGLWAPSYLNIGGKQYVGAFHADSSYVLPAGAVSGITSSPAAAGETILMYGIGFGSTSPNFPAGQTVTSLNSLTPPLLMNFGSTPAPTPFPYDGLLPPFVGLYQFNVTVPNVSTDSALPFSFSLGGASGSQTLFIAVK